MRAQRPPEAAPCLAASAEALPLGDAGADAALAILTVHHWTDYLLELCETDAVTFPTLERTIAGLGGRVQTTPVPIPADCRDGFLCAYWRRPHAYLDPEVRANISTFGRFPHIDPTEGLARLVADLESGAWEERNAELLDLDELDLGYRLLVAEL